MGRASLALKGLPPGEELGSVLQNDSGVPFRRAFWRAPQGTPLMPAWHRWSLQGFPSPCPPGPRVTPETADELASSPVAGAVLFPLSLFHTNFRETLQNLPLGPQHGAPDLV